MRLQPSMPEAKEGKPGLEGNQIRAILVLMLLLTLGGCRLVMIVERKRPRVMSNGLLAAVAGTLGSYAGCRDQKGSFRSSISWLLVELILNSLRELLLEEGAAAGGGTCTNGNMRCGFDGEG